MPKQRALGAGGGNHGDWTWQKPLCRLAAVEERRGSWRACRAVPWDELPVPQQEEGDQVR